MLRGGNAVDAAIATLFCNGLVTMQSMGIGGGFLMNVYIRAENKSYSIIARETAPKAISEDMFQSRFWPVPSRNSPLFIGVPGEVMGYGVAYKRFGSLKWQELLQPTIDLCYHGFPLSLHQRDSLLANAETIYKDATLSKTFVDKKTGEFYETGSHIMPPKELCLTFTKLAKNGPDDFYKGTLARQIARDLKDMESVITLKDLEDYSIKIVDSVTMTLGDDTLHLTPPVGSGYILGFVMNILWGYKERFSSIPKLSGEEVHIIGEALKFGFVKRWMLEDGVSQEV